MSKHNPKTHHSPRTGQNGCQHKPNLNKSTVPKHSKSKRSTHCHRRFVGRNEVDPRFRDYIQSPPIRAALFIVTGSFFFAWILSPNRFGSWDNSSFAEFLGISAGSITVLTVLVSAHFISKSELWQSQIADQMKTVAAGLTGGQASSIVGPDVLDSEYVSTTTEGRTYEHDGVTYSILGSDDIPIRVWAALINSWDKEGQTGKWLTSDFERCIRVQGQGNYPWNIEFSTDKDHIYRIAFGGRGKRGATVTKYQKDDWWPSDSF